MRRYALRDDQWERIKDFLPGREGHVGGTGMICGWVEAKRSESITDARVSYRILRTRRG
jgi:hypothetical protein